MYEVHGPPTRYGFRGSLPGSPEVGRRRRFQLGGVLESCIYLVGKFVKRDAQGGFTPLAKDSVTTPGMGNLRGLQAVRTGMSISNGNTKLGVILKNLD